MSPFTQHSGIAAPLLRDNVDTDTIIPSREMRSTGKTGLRDGLFAPWRYRDAETRLPDPDFVLNQPAYASATILASGANFGCGSSREHAVWALADYGIRCIVAESFAPIFYNNCVRNGLLPVELDRAAIIRLAGNPVFVDLATQTISCEDEVHEFAIGAQAKLMLLGGFDAIDMTLLNRAAIDEWCRADRIARPWIYPERRA